MALKPLSACLGLTLVFMVCLDAFEYAVLPRRPTRRLRLARIFYAIAWPIWGAGLRLIRNPRLRQSYLSYFGPLSLVVLLMVWACGLICGFGILTWGMAIPLNGTTGDLPSCIYLSGITFFTVGYGDVTPVSNLGRLLAICEAGMGLGFLAVVIGYFPVLYQAFSRRETGISLLDARAGSPPTAAELLRRHGRDGRAAVETLLADWERWSAELLESHISYPVLCFYRSQHDNQSWLSALSTVLDTCALIITGLDGLPPRQAQLTFAMARHAVVDLAQIFNASPRPPQTDRLPAEALDRLRQMLISQGIPLQEGDAAIARLHDLRAMYEGYVASLGDFLVVPVAPFILDAEATDNWRTSAWGRVAANTPGALTHLDEHA